MTGDLRVCEHGSLRRKCPICDSAEDIKELEAKVTQSRATLADVRKVRDEWYAEYTAKRDECDRLTSERDEWKAWHASMQALRDKHSASVDRLLAERDLLRAALEQSRAILREKNRGTTHWHGCDKHHPGCAMLKIIAAALAPSTDDAQGEK